MDEAWRFLFSPWGWLTLAGILALLELLLPGAVMLWLAGAALATAIQSFAFGLAPGGQLVAFAIWTVAALALSRMVKARRPIRSQDEQLNRRGEQLVGAQALVVQAIGGGHGKVRLGDTEWLAYGPAAPAGTRVRVVGVNGATLRVVPEGGQSAPLPPAEDPRP